MKPRIKAIFVTKITVIDPDTKQPVSIDIFKEVYGGMLGVDSSYLENGNAVTSPFGNGFLELD